MARRKNGIVSDGSDSDASQQSASEGYNSQEDGDSRAERALFEQKPKRRRVGGGKASAWEGIFGEGDDEDRGPRGGLGGRGGRGGRGRGGKTDWTKAPAFVSKSTVVQDDQAPEGLREDEDAGQASSVEERSTGSEGEEESGSESGSESDEEPERRSPRVREEEEEVAEEPTASRGGLRARAKQGAGRSGIGSARRMAAKEEESAAPSGTSTPRSGDGQSASAGLGSFGRRQFAPPPETQTATSGSTSTQPRRSFMPKAEPAAPAKPTQLTATEVKAFQSMQGSLGFKLLAGMGWAPGKGLGKDEDGRAVPVDAGKHMRGQGISAGIRTEDSKREARRKGVVISDDSEDERQARRSKGKGKGKAGAGAGNRQDQEPRDQSWKKQRKVKVKVEHKTYEQIIEESEQAPSVGLVLDARSGELKEVSSLSALSLSPWAGTAENAQLPELRHNLRLIAENAKGDVDGLAKEGRRVKERRRWALREEQIARQRVDEATSKIARLERIKDVIADISQRAVEESVKLEPSLDGFASGFDILLDEYKAEYSLLGLDEVIVGAIGQVTRQAFADWDPFSASNLHNVLRKYQRAFNLPSADAVAVTGAAKEQQQQERLMTAWESFMWTTWMPKVRSAINNDWDARSPHAAVTLIEAWDPILPAFIRDNVFDQLLLPKIKEAIDKWTPKSKSSSGKSRSLSGFIFPWLPLLGARMEEILEPAKRRMRAVLRNWMVRDGVPDELHSWRKNIYSSSEFDKLALQFIVPKLGIGMRDDFAINPAAQEMSTFEAVVPWHKLLRASMFTHLFDVEFWPKWLDILYIWLASPGCKADEVASWFTWWKSQFPSAMLDMPAISHGFTAGLGLMNDAMQLGTSAPQQLRRPTFKPLQPTKSSSSSSASRDQSNSSKTAVPLPVRPPAEEEEFTFRSLAEDYASQQDLVFVPLGRSHADTGKPLFRVAKGVDGRGGVTVYVGEEAVFALVEDGSYRAVTLEDMAKRAGA